MMLVKVNLVDPWHPLSTTSQRGEHITIYRHGSGARRCFFICRNSLRREDVVKRVVEAEVERDAGGVVVTVLQVVEGAQGVPLSRVIAQLGGNAQRRRRAT